MFPKSSTIITLGVRREEKKEREQFFSSLKAVKMNKSMIPGHIILKSKAIYLSLKFIRYSNGTECLPKVNQYLHKALRS